MLQSSQTNGKPLQDQMPLHVITGWKRWLLMLRVRAHLFRLAVGACGSVVRAIKTLRKVQQIKQTINGSKQLRRSIEINNRSYFGLYIPSFPSAAFDSFIHKELNRIQPFHQYKSTLQIVQLAVTSACPLHCEHCFEWNNLRKKDPFNAGELKKLMYQFIDDGCSIIHFTGGEPMVKLPLLMELLKNAPAACEYWILTSGWGLNEESATALKKAGLTGAVISLDHYNREKHNQFRGSEHAFDDAINAAIAARKAGLVTAFSVCVTKTMANTYDLMNYAELAKQCGVAFVQLLEPKAVGHYQDQPVQLLPKQLQLLEQFYLKMNFDPQYKTYPLFMYHGFHQRRIGCQSAGKRILYIDSAGFIDACPFCQTRTVHAGNILNGTLAIEQISIEGCPAYSKQNNKEAYKERSFKKNHYEKEIHV
jgi:MoaA/NifB/PqqE/SkfB family radical SAM enzyme